MPQVIFTEVSHSLNKQFEPIWIYLN